jgi:hypothetical protein
MQSKKLKKQNRKERESYLLRPVSLFLKELGFSNQVREIPYFYNVVDVFGIGTEGNVAVEMKLRRWRKAIKQARVYQLFAHKVYISMPIEYASRPPRDLLLKLGIGLIAIEFTSLRPLIGNAILLLDAIDSQILKSNHAAMMEEKAQQYRRKKWHKVM